MSERLSISTLEVGAVVRGELAVTKAEKKVARNGAYAMLTLTDGELTIVGKRWQYDDELPQVGSVLFIIATVDEYRGTKGVNISRWRAGELPAEEFAVKGPIDLEVLREQLSDTLVLIQDSAYRAITEDLFRLHINQWYTKPAAIGVHHNYVGGLLQHTLEVVTIALAQSVALESMAGMSIDMDLLMAGALLHDLGKIRTYEFQGAAIEMTTEGKLLEHITMGTHMILSYETDNSCELYNRKVQKLAHCVAAHHGCLEWGSPVLAMMPEAMLIHYADQISAKSAMMDAARKQTDREWTDKQYQLGVSIYNGK